jgi:hypothetical protein
VDFERQIPEELQPLTSAEQSLLSSLISKGEVDWQSGDPVIDDPKNFRDWNQNREIRARFFQWLCTDATEVHKQLRQIKALGIHIRGRLIFSYREITIPLTLQKCAIPAGIDLVATNCRLLDLSGSHLGSISASNMSASLLSVRCRSQSMLKLA